MATRPLETSPDNNARAPVTIPVMSITELPAL